MWPEQQVALYKTLYKAADYAAASKTIEATIRKWYAFRCKMGDLVRAEITLLVMKAEGHMPDSATYNMLLMACCKLHVHTRLSAHLAVYVYCALYTAICD